MLNSILKILKYNKLTLKRLEILESKNKNILKFILKIVGKNNSNNPITAKSNIPVVSNSNNPIALHKKDLKIVVNKILNTWKKNIINKFKDKKLE